MKVGIKTVTQDQHDEKQPRVLKFYCHAFAFVSFPLILYCKYYNIKVNICQDGIDNLS